MLPSDHIGWWVVFFFGKAALLGFVSYWMIVGLLLAAWKLGAPIMGSPDWASTIAWGALWVILEITIGTKWAAHERRRFGAT
jgi:hypothetical protein